MEYALQLPTISHLHGFAAGLATLVRAGDVIALSGPVGAGKTTLVIELVRLLTGENSASSPSFPLWQQYTGATNIHHLDLYRIEDPRELRELGLEEAFTDDACTIVEWPERAPHLLPPQTIWITLEGAGDDARSLHIKRGPLNAGKTP